MKTKCIETDLFQRYAMGGRLQKGEREKIEAHLFECDICLETLLEFRKLSDELELMQWGPADDETVRKTMKALNRPRGLARIYKWVEEKLPAGPESRLEPVLVRGDSDTRDASGTKEKAVAETVESPVEIERPMDDLVLLLSLEKKGENTFDLRASVRKDDESAPNARLYLIRDGGGIVSIPVAEDQASFEDMPFGAYRVLLKQNAREKGRFLIECNEEEVIVKDDCT